jgi:hypothetical protein
MASEQKTIVTHHSDGTQTTEVVDWTAEENAAHAAAEAIAWKSQREQAYPPHADYLDGIVKGDQAQVDKYIADCLAVKALYPKGDS